MNENEDYIKRLENIVDRQDRLLDHADARVGQLNAIYEKLDQQHALLTDEFQRQKEQIEDLERTVEDLKKVLSQKEKENLEYEEALSQLKSRKEAKISMDSSKAVTHKEILQNIKDKDRRNISSSAAGDREQTICPNCGKKIVDASYLFCDSCGHKLS